jgi:hypothetical protein
MRPPLCRRAPGGGSGGRKAGCRSGAPADSVLTGPCTVTVPRHGTVLSDPACLVKTFVVDEGDVGLLTRRSGDDVFPQARVSWLFDLRRAPSVSSLTIGGFAGCSATVLGVGSCLCSGIRRRRVSPA